MAGIDNTLEEHIAAAQNCFNTCEDVYNKGTTAYLTAKLLGGINYTLGLTAKNKLDTEYMDDTIAGEFMDRKYGSYGLFRLPETQAQGIVKVVGTDGTSIPNGTVLTASGGGEYTVTMGGVITGGILDITVESVEFGTDSNLDINQALTNENYPLTTFNNFSVSGAVNVESDDSYRQRYLALYSPINAFGGSCAITNRALALPNVTRTWLRGSNNNPLVYVAMDDLYDNSEPTESDINNLNALYDNCGTTLGNETTIVGITAKVLQVELVCKTLSLSLDDIEAQLRIWLVQNAELGSPIDAVSLKCFIESLVGTNVVLALPDNTVATNELFTTGEVTLV